MNRLQLLKAVTQILPFILSSIVIFHSILYFLFDLDLRVFSLIGGSSLFTIIYLWINSWVFRFCFYQKVFLYYLTFIQGITIIDEYCNIPITTENYYLVMYITFGYTIISYSVLKFKENAKLKYSNQKNSQRSTVQCYYY